VKGGALIMTKTAIRFVLPCALMVTLSSGAVSGQPPEREPPWQAFLAAGGTDDGAARRALREIGSVWRDGYTAMLVDIARLLPSPRGVRGEDQTVRLDDGTLTGAAADRLPARPKPGAIIRSRLTSFLEERTGRRFGDDLRAWRRWMWGLPYDPHPDYAALKAELYARIDPAFRGFFPDGVKATIRLDEIDWGGVRVNGIPPLRSSKVTDASSAGWLRDSHIVFGVEIHGEARAYPKRILAWHELATDTLGGVDLAIVYCTLCGTVIPYHSTVNGRGFTFGTSGLLYRSNKLMFDEETRSLWSSLQGIPVVGPLAGSGIQLASSPAVTTTWGEWKREHPHTTVLSRETGFDRDYSEGSAYRDYFATDRLMFDVPGKDTRLKNKAEVLVIRPERLPAGAAPVAIAADLLKRTPIFSFEAGGRGYVVLTSREGANRVYERGGRTFMARDASGLRDADSARWRVLEDALVSEAGDRLARVPAHRVFWFAWRAQYPNTALFK
jgi:hypothetical protein